ncbi:DUF6541 family protein [Microbacterium sediminis]|uniref:Uncharacterized protein n=1 Tax=Microbacterium sediminis TaxID=904291 RepID=A0A1B9NBB3_9MICO|nr:DUF6541 family protein [Microbacterium sediminis]OCG73901.1 hypothetical protein A7J15_06735 [Microbacterium sediminis]QBR74653.1 hypothetical protein E3O41_09775 [Microbacterium sediminis]
MTWVAAVPAILTAMVLAVGPGLIALAPLPLGLLGRVAVAGPVGVCVTGVAAAIFGAAGLPFHAWQVLPVALAALGVAFAVRRRLPRLDHPVGRGAWAMVAAWALSLAAAACVAFWGVPDPDRISQTYDNVFHLSATAAILDGFSASPLTLRSLIETDGAGLIDYYPAAWHELAAMTAQISGASVPVAFNAVWLAVLGLVWLPGIAWLTRVLTRGWISPIVAMPLGVSLGWYPYGLLTWGTIYPTWFAHALLPAAVAVTVLGVRAVTAAPAGERLRAGLIAGAGHVATLGAIGLAHPRVLPTWLVIVVPLVLWRLGSAFAAAWREGGATRRRAVVWLSAGSAALLLAALAAFAYAVVGLGLFDEPLENRLSGPQAQAVQTLWDGIWQVVMLRAMTGVDGMVTLIAPLLALAVIAGIVVALRRPAARWIVVSYALLAVLYVLAAGSDDVVTKLATGVWYKDRFRLAAALPVLAVPLATMGILAVARRVMPARGRAALRAGSSRAVGAIAIAGSAVIALTSTTTLAATGVTESVASVFHQPDAGAQWQVVSTQQIAFQRDVVAAEVPADQRVLGDPWDGSALTQLFAGREPVFPHVNGQWDLARQELAWRLAEIETNPAVCAALDELRVRHVLYNPHEFGGGDPAGNHFPGPHAAVEAGLFTPVATDGESVLYRIDQCGPLD